MQQLMMECRIENRATERSLPDGYKYECFNGTERDISDWKQIMQEPPFLGPEGGDECYRLMIEEFPDVVAEKDIQFVVNEKGERVASITTISKKDGSGYVHMVKAKTSEQGKGIGNAMIRYALRIFAERQNSRVILTTDDFRLAAIKTYLNAGFLPVIYHDPDSDMEARWSEVLNQLKISEIEKIFR